MSDEKQAHVELLEPPLTDAFVAEFVELDERIFPDTKGQNALKWRLEKMPDVTVCTVRIRGRLVGFKVGYATADHRYYSWLGGVDPNFRRQGIARRLMDRQHAWLGKTRFQLVEAHVEQNNKAMIELNLTSGLNVTGFFLKDGKPHIIMQKMLQKT